MFKYFFIAICLISILYVVTIGLKLTQDIRSDASPSTNLSFKLVTESKNSNIKIQDNIRVQTIIATGVNQTIGSQISIKFDPQKLTLNDIEMGDFYSNAVTTGKNIDNVQGQADISLFIEPNALPKSGTGVLVNLLFTALSDGKTQIEFNEPNTIVVAVNEDGKNVVASYSSLNLNILKAKGKK